MSIQKYDSKAKAGQAYMELAKEMIENE